MTGDSVGHGNYMDVCEMLRGEIRELSHLFMKLRMMWICILAGFFASVSSLTSPCQQSLIDQCGRLITGFTPQKYLSGLVPDSAIRDDCEAFASVRLCNDKVLKPCLAAELVTLDPFIRQANEFIMLFCENDQFRRDYAHHGQCLAVVSSDINQCIANYGATVSDIAAVSDNLPPQEVLHRSCCDGLHRLTQCSFDAAVRKCHPSSADFVKKFLYKMMKSTLQDWIARQCFEYQSQCGFDQEASNRQNVLSLSNMTHLQDSSPLGTADASSTSGPPSGANTVHSREESGFFTGSAATGTRSSVTAAEPSLSVSPAGNEDVTQVAAAGTHTVLSHSLPDANNGASGGGRGENGVDSNITMADDAVVSGAPFGSTEQPNTSLSPDDNVASQIQSKTFSIKTVSNEKSKSARIRNAALDTHPLARKFLLIISTIAFLAGWY